MDERVNETVIKLFASFDQFSKLNWNPSPVCELNRSEIFTLLTIKKIMDNNNSLVKVSDISKIAGVTPPTITPLITSLEKKGYLIRNISKTDRRVIEIELTEKGSSTIDKVIKVFFNIFEGLVEYLGFKKSNEFVDILSLVFNYFDNLQDIKKDNKNNKEI
ncbi:MarR family winged helix-turn-helix transcriptional regulator [Pseudobacteroides cellulosolvens]|uniref:HTH-type transcriptional regulator SarZ n=1 Tax=Pseudobacteroides cellulosolvens ATCC 35603 = DSM 2933 TaxID=398512 RepID=A0A0L6JJC7_9FIRM|nr:MarR family transcriptional regulator [Pseudobacteroides cellulosolvens]KNY25981.1 transcriptional regulator, MarR family [Pseudobacteroides cellulosolvens ATCC 35603 = DSM 2933]